MKSVKEINIEYRWDKSTYLQGSKSLYNDVLRHSPKRFIGWFFIALSQFGLVAFFRKGVFGLLLLSTFGLLYWYVLRWPLRKWILINAYKKSPMKDKEINVIASDKFLLINDIKILWSEIQRVLLEKEGFLLYYHDDYIYIPKDAFKDQSEEKSFLKLLKTKVKNNIVDDRRS